MRMSKCWSKSKIGMVPLSGKRTLPSQQVSSYHLRRFATSPNQTLADCIVTVSLQLATRQWWGTSLDGGDFIHKRVCQ